MSGCVYESVSDFKAAGKTEFVKIRELEGKKIVEISGSFEHCYAVCEDGTVFARGLNDHGQLGIDRREADEFTEISSLKKYKITSASAGGWHSLFLTSDGKVLACGYNRYGQLFLNNPSEKNIDSPIETTIATGATFIYAGGNMSTVFVNTNPPPNSPNMLINKSTKKDAGNSKFPKKILVDSNSSDLITKLRQEILDLKEENSTMKEENTNLKKEISDLKDKNSTMKNENTNLKKEISRHQKEKQDFRILDYDTLHSLRVIRDINYGGSGKVVEVIREKKYAMKVMNISDTNFDNQQKFINEYESLITLNHPNIVRAYGIYLSDETTPLTILLELCKHDISKAIKECIFSKVDVVKIIYQIAEAMKFVHSKGFVHRDLKPSNILIGFDGLIRISDFGIAKLMSSDEQLSTLGVGTQKFMAPEILLEAENYNEKVDVYSFGVVAFFILSGGKMPKINIINIGKGKKAEIPAYFTKLAKNLISDCWNFEPNKRPGFGEIVEIITKNNFKVVDLNDSEISEVKSFVREHKKKIPSY